MSQGFSDIFSRCGFGLVLLALVGATGCKKKSAAGGAMQAPPTQVVVVEARQQPIAEKLALVGSLAGNEIVEMKSETEGTVAEILFAEGQPVQKGDLLIRLDDSKLAASLAESEANHKLGQVTYERNKQLYQEKLVSQQEFDQAAAQFQANQATLELRKRQLQDARIYAPFAGVAGARSVSPGQVISKDTTLTWLVDSSVVKAEFNVPERFLGEVKVGQAVELIVAAFPKEKFRGEVYFIAPHLDAATRTALVKARIKNEDLRLKPGMFANLDLTVTTRDSAVVVPETALVRVMQDNRAILYTVTRTNTVALRPVTVGIRLPGQVEVTQGLAPGERVIIEGVQKVGPNSRVIPVALEAPPQAGSNRPPASTHSSTAPAESRK